MTNAISADRLRSFIERIERMIEERDAINADIKDVFSEAKGVGYDVKTMRKVIQLRAMDASDRAEQEALLDTYMHALGMIDRIEARVSAGESIRQIEKAEGVPRSTVHRVSQKAKGKTGGAEMGHSKPDVISPPEVEILPAHDPDADDLAWGRAEAERLGLTESSGDRSGQPEGAGPVSPAPSPLDTSYKKEADAALRGPMEMPPIPDFLRRVAS